MATSARWFLLGAVIFLFATGCGNGGELPPGVTPFDVWHLTPAAGIEVMQVSFPGGDVFHADTAWGRLAVHLDTLAVTTGIEGGCLNVVSADGRVVVNIPLPPPSERPLELYFDLGNEDGTEVTQIDLEVLWTAVPLATVAEHLEGPVEFEVTPWTYAAQGMGDGNGDGDTVDLGDPPETVPIDEVVPLGQGTFAYYQPVTNVQAANNQCVTMAMANCLQYLEDEGAVNLPNAHVPGLGVGSDTSLVGRLDDTCDRVIISRSVGSGVTSPAIVEGTFEYLLFYASNPTLTYRHQGRGGWNTAGYSPLPAGDVTYHAGTTTDEGAVATWDWTHQRLVEGCAIYLAYSYPGGGHAVRVTGTGRLAGKPWIRFSHDALQTNHDPTDTKGLCDQLIWPQDLDGDGKLNYYVNTCEIELVWAICP